MPKDKQLQKPGQKRQRTKREPIGGIRKRSKEPIDYGVTKKQFLTVLERASQPTEKAETNRDDEGQK
jgi:hypothetical protein